MDYVIRMSRPEGALYFMRVVSEGLPFSSEWTKDPYKAARMLYADALDAWHTIATHVGYSAASIMSEKDLCLSLNRKEFYG